MSRYGRGRVERTDNSPWAWMAAIGIVLILVGFIFRGIDNAQNEAVRARINDLESRRQGVAAVVDSAEKAVEDNAKKYARHWSAGFAEALQQARQVAGKDGQIAELLTNVIKALDSGNRDGASQLADQAEGMLNIAFDVPNKVLGPPPFYDELARKDKEAQAFLTQVGNSVDPTKQYIDGLRGDGWNAQHGVVFARVYRRLSEAQSQLGVADLTLKTRLVDDNVETDKPKAYDEAAIAQSMVNEARNWADEDHRVSREADGAIANARTAIANAETYILFSNYRTFEAQSALDSGAKASLSSAEAAFWGNPSGGIDPNFVLSRDLANQAVGQAQNAALIAATPVPTPIPPPTSVPSSSADGDSTSDSGWDSSSDDSSSDWGSNDDWGSSDDWSSSDDWGGSDDWGSNDDWSSSDDWGSDDGW